MAGSVKKKTVVKADSDQKSHQSNSSEEAVLEFTRKLQNYPTARNSTCGTTAAGTSGVWRKLVAQQPPAQRERAHTATGKMVVPQLTIEQPSPPAG